MKIKVTMQYVDVSSSVTEAVASAASFLFSSSYRPRQHLASVHINRKGKLDSMQACVLWWQHASMSALAPAPLSLTLSGCFLMDTERCRIKTSLVCFAWCGPGTYYVTLASLELYVDQVSLRLR